MSSQNQYPKCSILGVDIDVMTMDEATDLITEYIASRKPAVYISKPYVEFIDLAASDTTIKTLLNNSFATLPDSVAMQWASLYIYGGKQSFMRLFKTLSQIVLQRSALTKIIPERFAGADFSWKLLAAVANKNLVVYIIGHPVNSSIDHTAETIQNNLPRITIAGTFDGYKVNHDEAALVTELLRLKPDLILVGTGFPRQEQLMSRLIKQVPYGVFIGEGGTFDYESFGGTMRRAPAWMRTLGLEWLWRLLLQPSRIKRQLAIPRFIWKVYREHK
jgi:N-acetylglucosaminyldiphosphoundecaprenol N-acetyl-beta-D-mannosaminyltransferase